MRKRKGIEGIAVVQKERIRERMIGIETIDAEMISIE